MIRDSYKMKFVALIVFQALWTSQLIGIEAHRPQISGSTEEHIESWSYNRHQYGCCSKTHAVDCPAEQREAWSYNGRNGPRNWWRKYPICYSRDNSTQSPINIVRAEVILDKNFKKLKLINYDIPLTKAYLTNDGHTVYVEPKDGVPRTIEVPGTNRTPPKTYTLKQFHFHWGENSSCGAEHTIDKAQYAMEVHFVHLSWDEKVAVVGAIFQEKWFNNRKMEPLVKSLKNIEFKGDYYELSSNFSLESMVPANPFSYYTYQGSLTTPECKEGVTWLLAKDFVRVGKQQMLEFRNLKSVKEKDIDGNCSLVNNYRPIQPQNRRPVFTSV